MKHRTALDRVKEFIYDYQLFIHIHKWQVFSVILSAFVLGQFAAFLKWNIFFYLH
jgi:hypothetical protein